MVDGDAVGRADLVHARVALADRLLLVELDRVLLAEVAEEALGDLGEAVLVDEREDAGLHRRHARREVHVDARRARRVGGVRLAEERERAAVGARRRLDHMREVALGALLVEVAHLLALAAAGRVGLQVEVGAVGDALELAEAGRGEREAVLDVARARAFLRVVREFVAVVLAEDEVLAREADLLPPREAPVAPPLVPLVRGVGADEELDLHLLELAAAEGEVARRDLVAEGLADLRDAERHAHARRIDDVPEVDEDALRGLGAQVRERVLVADRAAVRLEHEVELPRLGERAGFLRVRSDRAGALLGGDRDEGPQHMHRGIERVALLVLRERLGGGRPLLFVVLDEGVQARTRGGRAEDREVVGAVALLALPAVDHRIVESADMARGDPDLRVHDDRGVDADDVDGVAIGTDQLALDHIVPPRVLQVPLERCAHRAVIPEAVDAAVDLGGLEDESAAAAEGDDVVHLLRGGGGGRRGGDFGHGGLDQWVFREGTQDIGSERGSERADSRVFRVATA